LVSGQAQKAGKAAPLANPTTDAAKDKVLLAFPGGKKGGNPSGKLIFDSAGNLYGTTVAGGAASVATAQNG
jgi:hypothetical protein